MLIFSLFCGKRKALLTQAAHPHPSAAVFLCIQVGQVPSVWWVDRAEYNTRKGNKPSRLASVVKTRRLFNVAELLKRKEAQP